MKDIDRLPPLFTSRGDLMSFFARHGKNNARTNLLSMYEGECYLGIDIGSYAIKSVLIGNHGQILNTYYEKPIVNQAIDIIKFIKGMLSPKTKLVKCFVTGLFENANGYADGFVEENSANLRAACFMVPTVDCVIEIGAKQVEVIKRDRECNTITSEKRRMEQVGDMMVSAGEILKVSIESLATMAFFASTPFDFSIDKIDTIEERIKYAIKNRYSVPDISAGISYLIVETAIKEVLHTKDSDRLGKHIVVQGGTFDNKAVLRAFEKIFGIEVICPSISKFMGAYGAALIAKDNYSNQKRD